MEDKHTMLAEGIPFFGVYDGHGGTGCAEYLRDNLHRLILSHPEVKTQPDKALREGILEADRAFLKKCEAEQTDSGCVCAVVLLVGDKLVVGNVGDTEIVLCRDGKATALTTKHSPKFDPTEADRIRAVGGKMIGHRVAHPKFNGRACSLAVSRAIGDATFKLDSYTGGQPSGIIAEPYTTVRRITPQDEFLVIGCDGLWDVLTHQEVVDICRQCDDDGATPHMITEALVDEAMLRGSTDNVTVAFVSIQSIPHGDLSRNRSSAFSISRKGSDCYSMSGK
ncbi:protein phosphatase [Angomonas deanei]|uniref:Protein phosphatase 2C, putative n=1 Tax=Angomonas deanei TaxID=59799 RepID=A0A7G2C5E4_9TRYP|nr:protein phosphatase [Angomonas deanei]CAD2214956.1 Protein phosphatase 2C, putative [Angomonas deanei]|eukprot:EPY26469.1 protein phosphatase [Angomonas deanei]